VFAKAVYYTQDFVLVIAPLISICTELVVYLPYAFCECHWGIIETWSHYFLHYPLYAAQRQKLFSISAWLLPTIWSSLSENQKVHIFLYGSDKLGYADNQTLLHNGQLFILNSKRFTNCVHDS
jgi:hypothetical protein